MIQRERERRESQLRAEEVQDKIKVEALAKTREIAIEESRLFLKDLKIPEYLQAIIDEVQLKKAHVLYEGGGGNVSLVWDIQLLHSVGTEERRTDRGSLIGFFNTYSDEPENYSYRSLSVRGDSKNNLLSIEGRRVMHDLFKVKFPQQLTPPILRSLSNPQSNPEETQRTLVSTYLDTEGITSYERREKWGWAWPFEKFVSELNGLYGLTYIE